MSDHPLFWKGINYRERNKDQLIYQDYKQKVAEQQPGELQKTTAVYQYKERRHPQAGHYIFRKHHPLAEDESKN